MTRHPDLELVQMPRHESFKAWAHGYPYRTVRWHFHPEYEIHLVTETSGTYLVGDHVGPFEPGNLVMTGPNLPHNWISAVGPEPVPRRSLVLQFGQSLIDGALALFPELDAVAPLLAESRHGVLFPRETAAGAEPLLAALTHLTGPARIERFMALLALLAGTPGRKTLASGAYEAEPTHYLASTMNGVLLHIQNNVTTRLYEADLARLSGLSTSAFSRRFRKHTGQNFVHYVNRLRVDLACQLLIQDRLSVTAICYETGFNNVSNFNRQFLALRAMSPSSYRRLHASGTAFVAA